MHFSQCPHADIYMMNKIEHHKMSRLRAGEEMEYECHSGASEGAFLTAWGDFLGVPISVFSSWSREELEGIGHEGVGL